jgi:hypothetical protein
MVIINFSSKRINAKYDMMFFSGLDRKLLKKLQFPFTAQIESGAVNYTAGFIVRSVAKRFSCKNCLSTFSQKDCDGRDNAFIRNKKYDQINASLLIPTAEFSNVVHYVLRCFSKIYPLVKYKNKVVTIIADHVKFSLKQQFPLWFEKCRKHTCYIIKYIILVKLQKQVLWESKTLRLPGNRYLKQNKDNKLNPKLRIL